ncbi:hypothetical protein [Saltwater crocodilepox virus]|nr:hypothetical protein [Saltwater crocodilepox virus]AVD69374.1 hypothetical protein [Saltwater crocodilepox virus]QGT46476.1 ORF037 [Saltwater crocodilepox virus]QGT46692.1 ORF037 [Saltwater crocodilepox virus]QGT46909.1 ORF037 [Saltwater crocodilepox virus]
MWKVALTIVWVLLSNQTAAIKESITQRECDDDPWYCTNNYQPRHNWFDEFVNWFLVFIDPIWSVDVVITEELEKLAVAASLIKNLEKDLADGLVRNGYDPALAGPRANKLMKKSMTDFAHGRPSPGGAGRHLDRVYQLIGQKSEMQDNLNFPSRGGNRGNIPFDLEDPDPAGIGDPDEQFGNHLLQASTHKHELEGTRGDLQNRIRHLHNPDLVEDARRKLDDVNSSLQRVRRLIHQLSQRPGAVDFYNRRAGPAGLPQLYVNRRPLSPPRRSGAGPRARSRSRQRPADGQGGSGGGGRGRGRGRGNGNQN